LDPSLASCAEIGATFAEKFPDSTSLKTLQDFVQSLLNKEKEIAK
jgi:hypothetical protein